MPSSGLQIAGLGASLLGSLFSGGGKNSLLEDQSRAQTEASIRFGQLLDNVLSDKTFLSDFLSQALGQIGLFNGKKAGKGKSSRKQFKNVEGSALPILQRLSILQSLLGTVGGFGAGQAPSQNAGLGQQRNLLAAQGFGGAAGLFLNSLLQNNSLNTLLQTIGSGSTGGG